MFRHKPYRLPYEIADRLCLESESGIFESCHCRGGSASSGTNTTTTTQSAAGTQVTGSQAVGGGQGSLNVGAGAKYQEQGSVDLSGMTDSTLNVTTADPQVVQSALDTVNQLNQKFASTTQSEQAALAALAQTVQTQGQSNIQNTLVIVAIVGAVVLVFWLIFGHFKKT